MAILLGLTGYKGSGKDTVAAYLIKEYGYERRAFADKLKQSAAALFGINPAEFETLKNDENARVRIETLDGGEVKVLAGMSVREFLQRYGTESHRDIFGINFWVDQVLPVGGYYADRDIVITDVRFVGEALRFNQLRGYVIRVNREIHAEDCDMDEDCTCGIVDRHSSESGQLLIEADYELDNSGSIKDIPEKVDRMLKELRMRKVRI